MKKLVKYSMITGILISLLLIATGNVHALLVQFCAGAMSFTLVKSKEISKKEFYFFLRCVLSGVPLLLAALLCQIVPSSKSKNRLTTPVQSVKM